MSAPNRCHACLRTEIVVSTGRGMLATIALDVDEIIHFAHCTTDPELRERLLTAAALLDFDKADAARMEIAGS